MLTEGIMVARRANTIILVLMLVRRETCRNCAFGCFSEAKRDLPFVTYARDANVSQIAFRIRPLNVSQEACFIGIQAKFKRDGHVYNGQGAHRKMRPIKYHYSSVRNDLPRARSL
jgi:hypothetical protein